MPLVLLFSPWPWLTWIAIISIWMLHTFIISTIPMAVPLEWNVFFMFVCRVPVRQLPAGKGTAVADMNPALLAIVVCVALAPIILGALRPQYVSFLVGMKQYAGNWASGTFSFRNKEMEDRINQRIVKAADNQIDQLDPLFGKEISEIFIQKAVAFRMMHPMGRMHISALMRHTDSLDDRVQREGEFVSNVLTGWNFGDGHCLDERLIAALQERCQYEPGDVVVAWTESQPAFSKKVQYRVIDAALGTRREGLVPQRRCLRRAAVAAQRPDPAHDHVDLPGYVAPGRRLPRHRRASVSGVSASVSSARSSSAAGRTGWPPRRRWPVPGSTSRCWRRATAIGGGVRSSETDRSWPDRRPLLGDPSAGRPLRRSSTALGLAATGRSRGCNRRSTAPTRSTTAPPACCTARSTGPPRRLGERGGDAVFGGRADGFDALARRLPRSRCCECRVIR